MRTIFDLAEHEGLVMGGSTGINVAGAVTLARDLGPGHTIVTILADYGSRYQSKLFNPEFLKERGLPTPPWLSSNTRSVVSTGWLAERLDDPKIRILSTRAGSCPARHATRTRSMRRSTFRARCASTSTRSSDRCEPPPPHAERPVGIRHSHAPAWA